MGYNRKKQPEQVQRALLECAAKIAADHGIAGVTVQAVADAAGVTKGGLFHHFSSKQVLLEGMVDALLDKLDAEIDSSMAEDPAPYGSFTRAYVKSVFVGKAFGFETPWSTLFMAVISDHDLRHRWIDWFNERLRRHDVTDGHPSLQIVRLAADGAWLSYVTADSKSGSAELQALKDQLVAMTEAPR
ncbi:MULTISPECIES: TetR/AcrR family transcriptional regulator [unclassified Ensifer]|uniref:TetR/AcrR family transcriptional regulator n=1 Tax=unclassified Ensifer TaxID=2633371 RepID=UPI000813B80E|nr:MULTISPECIES: TetR/AcrR family transcriptional regulator [unclassified Ensifer]OCP00662.1 TetR family transcriptional regulator [Ensifer sp. LC14]OCP07788.1 TetR family transcriptional regulator [Ensifer sp. LC11]OCP08552.1 TetR family transcriptional regulator [Ensifer sp. LC13]OCP32156.1 TetR family transcriptional regulator [Ensifer sp. LC499]